MKLFFQYCSFNFSNCYILAQEQKEAGQETDAIIIDPGGMDNAFLKKIENNNFIPRAVLITHDHIGHIRGLRTLKRIYDVDVYAINQVVLEHRTNIIKGDDKFTVAGFEVKTISIPGHSADSVVYQIDTVLFTGDVLTAGQVGATASAYGAVTQMNKLRSRLLTLPGDYMVMPGHGPPTTLEAERRFNTAILNFERERNKRPVFIVDL
jgi:glyoxylase-like metal-dependent hydrolase (beta-lactamase superfamily II)